MAASLIGLLYKDGTGSVDTLAATTSFQVMSSETAGSAAVDSNAVGFTAGANHSIRNTTGSSQTVDGFIVGQMEAFSSGVVVEISMGESSDDSSYSQITAADTYQARQATVPRSFVIQFSGVTVPNNEYIAPMFKLDSGSQTLQMYTYAMFVRSRDGGASNNVAAFSYTNRDNSETIHTSTTPGFTQLSATATDDIIAGCTGNNDLSFDMTTAATIDGLVFLYGRTDSGSSIQHELAGAKDTGGGLAVVSEQSTGVNDTSSTTSFNPFVCMYTTSVSSGDTIAPMIRGTSSTANLGSLNEIHMIWSRE